MHLPYDQYRIVKDMLVFFHGGLLKAGTIEFLLHQGWRGGFIALRND